MALNAPLPADIAIARFNASLRGVQKDTEKEMVKRLREVGNEARDEVRGSTRPPFRTGRTRKGIRTSVRRKSEVSLYSNEPQAPVWEWGGVIRPRGTPIEIPKTNFVTGAVLKHGDDFDERMADEFDQIAHRHGWF
jgi:hypothetical protein